MSRAYRSKLKANPAPSAALSRAEVKFGMESSNLLLPFTFDNQVAHGAIVQIRLGVSDFLAHRSYSADLTRLLGEAMAAMPLMATHLSFEGRINLQFQADPEQQGGMKLLVAQIDHHLNVRAMAKAPPDLAGSFRHLLSGGLLALTLEPSNDAVPSSQALVTVRGESLAESLEVYFEQSEQLPTLIRLAARGEHLAAFMLQRLPLQSARGGLDDWEHLRTLAATLQHDELLDTDPYTVLRRLFHQEDIRTFEPRPIQVACRCSRAGISRMLLSLGRQEVDEILDEQQRVSVTCEFCGREHVFTRHEAHELFKAADIAEPQGNSRH
jgi:molecular chaperone Hsp33